MGLLYGVDLLFPRSRLRTAVEALARLADPDGHVGCVLSIPGEQPLPVPFDASAEDEDEPFAYFDCARVDRFQCLEGSLWLPVDGAVRAYLEENRPCVHVGEEGGHPAPAPMTRITSAGEEALIGLVSIHIHCGVRYSVIHVGAVTTSMSCMFEDSAAIREAFLRLVREAGGVGALLDREAGSPRELLSEPGRRVELPRYDWEDPLGTIDPFVEAALAHAGVSGGVP